MAKQDTHHVVPNPDGGWNVKRGGGQKASHLKKQVKTAESMGLLDTSSIAIDASKVDANEKSVPRKNIKDDGQSANWGSKLDTNGNQITWFGYKLHIATDVKSELPVALSITPASTNDGIMAERILEECSNNLNSKPRYYLMDAGYDQKSIEVLKRLKPMHT